MEQLHDAEQWEYGALSDMIMKSDDAIVLADAQGAVLLANAGASEVVGIRPRTVWTNSPRTVT